MEGPNGILSACRWRTCQMQPSRSSISPTRTRSAHAGLGWLWLLLRGGAAGQYRPFTPTHTSVTVDYRCELRSASVPQVVQVCGRADHPVAVWDQPSHPSACVPRPGPLPHAARLQPRAVAHESGQPRHRLQPSHAVLEGLSSAAVQRRHAVLHAGLQL